MRRASGVLQGVLLGALALSCGGSALNPATGMDAGDGGEAGFDATAQNACGGFDALTYRGSRASPADPCGPCLDGVLVCAAANLLACSGARAASACPDASSDTGVEAAFADSAAAEGATDAAPTDAADTSDGGSADATDAAATASDAGDGGTDAGPGDAFPSSDAPADVASDAPAEVGAYDGGSGWQAVDGGPVATAFGDGGVPIVHCLPLATSDLVVDATRTVLYASVTSTSQTFGNSVVRIDPAAVAVSATVFEAATRAR